MKDENTIKKLGRKPLLDADKKKKTSVYLNNREIDIISKIESNGSFSRKCSKLIEKAIDEFIDISNDTIKFIDLFSGMGGIRIGFERAMNKRGVKTKCVMSSEIKKSAIKVYENYFKDIESVKGDISKIPSSSIPDFDYLLAGFPCQPFSHAGNRLGFSDTRGTLFFEIERIINDKKPRGFILENVEGLVNHDKGRTLKIILEKLNNMGYNVTYRVLDSSEFGLAQARKRVYIVGHEKYNVDIDNFIKKKSVFKNVQESNINSPKTYFSKKLLSKYSPEQLYGKSIKDKRGGKSNIHSWDIGIKGDINPIQKKLLEILLKERRKKKWADIIGIKWMDGMPLTLEQIRTFFEIEGLERQLKELVNMGYLVYEHPKEFINGRRIPDESKPKGYNIVTGKLSFEYSKILDPNGLTPTIVATDAIKLGVIDNGNLRPLTLREGARLFGFPDSYSFDRVTYRGGLDILGNTVSIPVIEHIADKIASIELME